MNAFLQTNLSIKASLPGTTDFVRAEAVTFPPEALREALLNAIVHRDYSRSDGSISISLFPRHLEIWNAGGLPEGVTLKTLREGGISRPRNPDLAHVLLLRGLIERMGIGGAALLRRVRKLACQRQSGRRRQAACCSPSACRGQAANRRKVPQPARPQN
ncbi:ATP-binding protein [Hymenobacter sp. J193]|uniref:ATP-binding protein n=1 Tax=Hymenobacter sp. J193 TaxID=2898429 RepID=UPI0035B3FA05